MTSIYCLQVLASRSKDGGNISEVALTTFYEIEGCAFLFRSVGLGYDVLVRLAGSPETRIAQNQVFVDAVVQLVMRVALTGARRQDFYGGVDRVEARGFV